MLNPESIRNASFSLMPTGYNAEQVDDALNLVAERLVGVRPAADGDDLELVRQQVRAPQLEQRGHDLAVREVAGRAEDHQRGRVDRQALEAFGEGVRLLGRGRDCGHAAATSRAGRRGHRTDFEARRSPSPHTTRPGATRTAASATG